MKVYPLAGDQRPTRQSVTWACMPVDDVDWSDNERGCSLVVVPPHNHAHAPRARARVHARTLYSMHSAHVRQSVVAHSLPAVHDLALTSEQCRVKAWDVRGHQIGRAGKPLTPHARIETTSTQRFSEPTERQ